MCSAASVETKPRSASQSATSRATTRSSDAVKDLALTSARTACSDAKRKRAMSGPNVPLRASARPNDLEMPSVASGAAPGRGGVMLRVVARLGNFGAKKIRSQLARAARDSRLERATRRTGMHKSLRIIDAADPRLRLPSAWVQFPTSLKVRVLARRLAMTLNCARLEGASPVALSAVQCGVPVRLFVYKKGGVRAIVNAEVVAASSAKATEEEMCVSLPRLIARVERPASVQVRYVDERGALKAKTLKGFSARLFQHEIDHHDGILITDRASAVRPVQARRSAR